MSTTVPVWTNPSAALIAPTVLPTSVYGGTLSIYRYEWDLSTKVGGMLVACIGRLNNTALSHSVGFRIRRKLLGSAYDVPGDYVGWSSPIAACSTMALSTTQAAQTSVAAVLVASATPTALGTGPALCLGGSSAWASTYAVTSALPTNAEFIRIGTCNAASSAILMDGPKKVATVAGEYITNSADMIGPLWLEGGAKYSIIFDASMLATGGPIAIALYGETYDTDTTT